MKKATSLCRILCALTILTYFTPPATASILWSDDVEPANPATWTSYNTLVYIGKTASGTVTVNGGDEITSLEGYLGYDPGSTGLVTIDGIGSAWTNEYNLYVGKEGNGTLEITDGGSVTVDIDTYVACEPGSSGVINLDHGTLTTRGLLAASNNLVGTGIINTNGLVSDVDLVFDATHGLNQTLTLSDNSGQNITINLDAHGRSNMGAGHSDAGTMQISDGITILSSTGYIGYKSGSTGLVTVNGSGSTWTNYSLNVGNYGSGTLEIADGGSVNSGTSYVGHQDGSTGLVAVKGSDSTWTSDRIYISGDKYRGEGSSGTLEITDGGAVISKWDSYVGCRANSVGRVTIDGNGSTWDQSYSLYVGHSGNGTFEITNGGTFTTSHSTYLGYESGSTGQVTIDGNGSTWNNNSYWLYVGHSGSGTFDVTAGGEINTCSVCIGSNSSSTGHASIDGNGSIWNNSWRFYVGESGNGTFEITNGGKVTCKEGQIGINPESTGSVTVDGSGSTWSSSNSLHVGNHGDGTLQISNGGVVTASENTYVAFETDSTGSIQFDQGTLNTGGLIASFNDLTGTGTINTNGLVSDTDLVFDDTHSLNQSWVLNENPGQNIAINLNVNGSGAMGAGHSGSGSMQISDGITVESNYGYIGNKASSTGYVSVAGSGSTWINSSSLFVGRYGSGTLEITEGGTVSGNSSINIGAGAGSTGLIIVDGNDSKLNGHGLGITVGKYGNGTLSITNGGKVNSDFGIIGNTTDSTGHVTVDGNGSKWTVEQPLFCKIG